MNNLQKIDDIFNSVSITHDFKNEKLVFLNTSDVLEGKILTDKYVKVASLKGQAKKTIQNGDILFSEIRPKNKRYALVDVKNPEDYVVSTKLMVLRNKNKDVLTKYAYYFLTYEGTLNYLQMRAENRIGSFPQITFDIVKTLELNVPGLPAQQRIIDVLSALDSKIENNNRINIELESLAKTIYDYWFVQFDFPDAGGKPYNSSGGKMVWNDKIKSDIPEGWQDGHFSDIADIIGGSTPSTDVAENFGSNCTPWITPKDLSLNAGNKFISRGEVDVTDKGIKGASLKIMPKDTVLLSSRAPIGYMAISTQPVTTNQGFKSFVPKHSNSSPFVYYVIKNALREIITKASGSTFKEISGTTLKTIRITVPPESVIEDYCKVVAKVFEQQKNTELENQKLKELRDWLLPMLMSGQVVPTQETKAAKVAVKQ